MATPFTTEKDPVYGRAVRLAPQVRRITAPNPSPLTHTGTQTYIAGGRRGVAVIDPGPADEGHIQTIIDALEPGEIIGAILVTHTHVDHSPGAELLKKRTGAPTFGFGAHGRGMSATMTRLAAEGADLGGGEGADRDFVPTVRVKDGDVIEIGHLKITALHTPGHISNHLCFDFDNGILFTGDLILGSSTTMVSPPDGDMAAFMASLRRLRERKWRTFFPGHGRPVTACAEMIDWQLGHRKVREAQIRNALKTGAKTPAEVTAEVYTDVDPKLHGAAARNVLAHLLGLMDEGAVIADGAPGPKARFSLKGR